jgi:predicted nuclease of predicted toxin-antitoxin system
VAKAARDTLRQDGHEVIWAMEWNEDPGDAKILELAFREQRVLVTLDKDFGELAVVRGIRHAGIIRLTGFPAHAQGMACVQVIRRFEKQLGEGSIVTVEPNRVRIRPPE